MTPVTYFIKENFRLKVKFTASLSGQTKGYINTWSKRTKGREGKEFIF
jgi:hypothetical protein